MRTRLILAAALAIVVVGAGLGLPGASSSPGPAGSTSPSITPVATGLAAASPTPQPSGPAPPAHSSPTPSPSPSPAPSPTTPPPAPSPSPGAAVAAGAAWITRWAPVRVAANDEAAIQANLGPGYAVTLTGRVALDGGVRWVAVAWRTPSRHGTGWLPAAAVTRNRPSSTAFASFDALDRSLAAYLATFDNRVGVEVVDVTRHVAYTWNASSSFITASSMKVPIMLTLLAQDAAAHRSLTSTERSLLTAMIESSDNAAAGTLYAQVGGPAGIARWLAQNGISGLFPASQTVGWGWSTIQPWTMAVILQRLRSGRILTAADRSYALDLMRHVIPSQRFGVGTGSPAGATVAMKNGWVIGPDGLWAVNSSGIVTLGRETYVITVYTRGNEDLAAGITIVSRVARAIGAALT